MASQSSDHIAEPGNSSATFPCGDLEDAAVPTNASTNHIGDSRRWKDHDEYQKALARLIRDLQAEEKTK